MAEEAAQHLHNCKFGDGLIAGHNQIANEVASLPHSVRCGVMQEHHATYKFAGKGGPDMTFRNYPRVGLDAFGEGSIINAAQQNVRVKAPTTPFAARQRESEKQHRYAAAAHAVASTKSTLSWRPTALRCEHRQRHALHS
jgi:hypothetical protein